MKITIAIVKKNNIIFDKMEDYVMPLLYKKYDKQNFKSMKDELHSYIWSMIKDYVVFEEINMEDLIDVACHRLIEPFQEEQKDFGDFLFHTDSSYTFPKKYIEILYCQPGWKQYQTLQKENMNNIGCLCSIKQNIIENNCVLIGNTYDLKNECYVQKTSITKHDIIRIIKRRYFFSGIYIDDDVVCKYYYQNPKYLLTTVFNITEEDNLQHINCNLFNYNLSFYFKKKDMGNPNKICTRLNGSFLVKGPAMILNEMGNDEGQYINLSIREIKRLNVLSYGRLYDRELKNDEHHEKEETQFDEQQKKEVKKKVIPPWSKYIIINKRMHDWQDKKDKCIYCNKTMTKPVVCSLCYRVKTCDTCMHDYYTYYHKEDCLFKK